MPETEDMASVEEKQKWQSILDAIPPYMINGDGAVKEWMSEKLTDHYNHRHFSHLFPVFPGNEVSLNDEKLVAAFKKAAEKRLVLSQSGWSFAHQAGIWARLGEGDKALKSLCTMTKGCVLDNFFTLHNDWRHMGVSVVLNKMAPVQLDALMGTVSAIQDMLFQYNDGTLFVLPARPREFEYVSAERMRFPDGAISIYADGEKVEATIFPHKENVRLSVRYAGKNAELVTGNEPIKLVF